MNRFIKTFLYILGIPKTIFFNFYYFSPLIAIKFPVIISHRVWLKNISGKVVLESPRSGMVQIGYGDVGIFDSRNSCSIWDVTGTVHFKGNCRIGHGCKISVNGELTMGEGVAMTAESTIVARTKVNVGNYALVSWDVLIMDTDFHKITEMESDRQLNFDKPIQIGDSVWIGCRSMILKGVNISNNSIIAAGSVVSKSISEEYALYGGCPVKKIKEGVKWCR